MIRLLTVIGARPQIIKAAAISRAIKNHFPDQIEERILHTGQHYDANMSQVFFDELGIPSPHYNLGVGSGSHGEQTAKMIEGIEKVLKSEVFDGVILYGDTNSTLAGAVAASKLHIPVFHIEAGLRSFNMSMPEEINRILCDQISSILFAPTKTACDNLEKEGIYNSKAVFKNGKGREVIQSGDVMYDNSLYFAQFSSSKSDIIQSLDLEKKHFILATIHRDNNTDDPVRLDAIIRTLLDLSEELNKKIVLPLHPRTVKLLPQNLSEDTNSRLISSDKILRIPPVSFFDMIELEKNAALVMTDSGGVQKEAFFFETPTVILRPETEWVEIVDNGAGVIADADYDRIVSSAKTLIDTQVTFPQLFGDGNASEIILSEIIDYLDN